MQWRSLAARYDKLALITFSGTYDLQLGEVVHLHTNDMRVVVHHRR
jgi:hypothetical protein